MENKNYNKKIMDRQAGNLVIKNLITKNDPLMVARCGETELNCCAFYFCVKKNSSQTYSPHIKNTVSNNAGVFPPEDNILDKFSEIYLKSISSIDIMAVWYLNFESYICNNFCKDADLVPLRSIEPYYDVNPWSMDLQDQTVLVISPFSETINSQYNTVRDKLFHNPLILPSFNLKTLKAVQSIAGTKTDFPNWIEAYNYMCNKITGIDFDIALIGAGAYGLPLAAFIKSIGKKAIHMGGAVQILFGIKGLRWDKHEIISKFYNSYWTTPSKNETPPNYQNVEGGCYW